MAAYLFVFWYANVLAATRLQTGRLPMRAVRVKMVVSGWSSVVLFVSFLFENHALKGAAAVPLINRKPPGFVSI